MRFGPDTDRGAPLTVQVNQQPLTGFAGETVAALLLAAGVRTFRRTAKSDEPRGLYCGMGLCFDCLVTVNGAAHVRACVTPIAEGMTIEIDPEARP
jgi:predicted molibdopterin-dependent oxidoreductase YjgC